MRGNRHRHGTVEFYSREIERPDGDTLRALSTLGTHVGHFIERKSAEAAHAAEARTSAALARVGQELISSLEMPVLRERLCEVSATVLDCDYSSTWMRDDAGRRLPAAVDVRIPGRRRPQSSRDRRPRLAPRAGAGR